MNIYILLSDLIFSTSEKRIPFATKSLLLCFVNYGIDTVIFLYASKDKKRCGGSKAMQRGLNTKRPTTVFFLGPTKPLPPFG